MQTCDTNTSAHAVLPLTPNITVLRVNVLTIDPTLTQILSCAPFLRHVEVQSILCSMSGRTATGALQALRSLSQSITWRPLSLRLAWPRAQSTVLELLAAFAGSPIAQAVSKLVLYRWEVEPPITSLRASFPNVLHFELRDCNQNTASSLGVAAAAWPMLRSIVLTSCISQIAPESQQPLEAAARTAAELKAGQPFEVLLRVYMFRLGLRVRVGEEDAARMDVLVAAINDAGGGKVDVRWVEEYPSSWSLSVLT